MHQHQTKRSVERGTKVVWETLRWIHIVEEQEMNDYEQKIFFTLLESLEKQPENELLMDIS
jgi:hypothetical protein